MQPVVLKTEEDYQSFVKEYNLGFEKPSERPPYEFPFTYAVPKCLLIAKKFVVSFVEFGVELNDMIPFVFQQVDLLLVEVARRFVVSAQNTIGPISVSRLSRVALNLMWMQKGCQFFEDWLLNVLSSTIFYTHPYREAQAIVQSAPTAVSQSSPTATVSVLPVGDFAARARFSEAMTSIFDAVIDHVFEQLSPYFSQTSRINWAASEGSGSESPSEYVIQIAAFIGTVASSMSALPTPTQADFHQRLSSLCAQTILQAWISPDVKRISEAGVEQMSRDVKHLSSAAQALQSSLANSGGTRPQSYAVLLQIVALLQSEKLEEFMDPEVRRTKYPSIAQGQDENLIILLEKCKDTRAATLLLKKNVRNRNKQIESLVAYLRSR